MSHKKFRNNHHQDPIASEVQALLLGVNLVPEGDKSKVEPATPVDPIDVESMLADADIDFSSLDSPVLPPKPSTEDETDNLLDGVDLTQPESAKPEDKIDFIIPKEDEETTLDSEEKTKPTEEKTDSGVPPDEPEVKAVVEEPVIENLEEVPPISWSFDQAEDADIEGKDEAEDEGPVSLDDDEYEPKEEDAQPHDFAEELKQAELRRQALINRLTKKFGPEVIGEIQKASEVLTEETMQNLLLQYWAEDQEFNADEEVRLAQERLNKKSWKQKIAESKKFGPIGSAILGAGLGIAGSVAARSGANILIKKALMNTVHHGLGEATAVITGGTFGAIKGYLHEKERRRDAKQLLDDIEHAQDDVNLSSINGVGGLQLINEAIKDGLKGDKKTMQKIFDWQTNFRFMAISEHQLAELAEHGLEQVEQGKAASEVILDNLAELLDEKANFEFKESKKKFKKTYDRGWEQMGKKMGKGALAGGITSLAAYELAHLIADAIGNIWDHYHPAATPPAALAPELAQAPSQPTAPEVSSDHSAVQAPSTAPAVEPSLPNQSTAEALPIPESPHHITNPTDYACKLTIQDQSFQDMVHKFDTGQVSGENGADSILNHHGVKADYKIPKLNGATLSDQLKEFVQANHDKLKDPETAQAVYRAVYNAAAHPTLLVDYQTGQLSAEQLASDWHNLSHNLSEIRGDTIVKDVNKFIASQHQLWNGDHLPKDIAEEFMKIQNPVDAASSGITAPDAAASTTSATAPSLPSEPSSPSIPSNPSAPFSTPVSFWQSPTGNGLKVLGLMGTATGLAGAGLYYRDKKDGNKEQVGQSEPLDKDDKKVEEEKKKPTTSESEEAKQENGHVEAEIVYNKPDTVEEFINYVQEDLELRLQDLPVNSVIMELFTGASGHRADILLSFQAYMINLGNLGSLGDQIQSFTTGNLGNIDLGQFRKIWFPDGESTMVYEVGDHIGIRDIDNPSRKPDFSKPGHFEFYYIK